VKQDLLKKIKADLRQVADKDKARVLARFFKTGKGEYGEGDRFLGVVVPEQRKIVKDIVRSVGQMRPASSAGKLLNSLLASPWHEERLTALLILVEVYKRGDIKFKKQIFHFYLKNIERTCPVRAKRFYGVNNWDLVDLSAPNIVGDYLLALSGVEGFNFYNKKDIKNFLFKLAKSKNIWSRRVAVLATFTFIKNNQFTEILELAEFLLINQKESHDLMHKAIGWMLREVGKRESFDGQRSGKKVLTDFLDKFGSQFPRTTLRYAIERFPESERQKYLKLKTK